jgi:predicted RNA binding protein with dsRBD fold (UPF0201 family)
MNKQAAMHNVVDFVASALLDDLFVVRMITD